MAFAGVQVCCGGGAPGAWLWRGAARRDALGPLQEAVGVGGGRAGGVVLVFAADGRPRRRFKGGFGFAFLFAWVGKEEGVEEGVCVSMVCSSKEENGDNGD